MAAIYLTASPKYCSLSRNLVHRNGTMELISTMAIPKKRKCWSPSLISTPAKKLTAYVCCGKESLGQRKNCTNGVAKGDGIGIRKFLKDKKIIVTGATGFIAKGIVEKILRTAPDVGKLYIFINAKDNDHARNRLKKEIINDEVFRLLKEEHGKSYKSFMLSKLIAVAGNLREVGLGINPEFAFEMKNTVDLIVNSAGNTTFDERFDLSLDINTRGACRLMQFAKSCKNLKLLLHLSTAFACGQQEGKVMEEPYSRSNLMSQTDIDEEMKLAFDHTNVLKSDDRAVSEKMKTMGLSRAIANGWHDTYSFTKAMAEMMLYEMRDDVPLVILRPSIVESAIKSPFPGWIQGNKTIDPILILFGKGVLKGFPVNLDAIFDLIPVDMVVDATLAALAKHGGERKPGLEIYHVTSSGRNPIKYSELLEYVYQHFTMKPLMDRQGRPIHIKRFASFNSIEECLSTQYSISPTSSHHSQIQSKIMEHAQRLAKIYEPYSCSFKAWFDDANTQNLLEALPTEEREIFDFNVQNINWKDYYTNVHVPGLKTHVLKGRGIIPMPARITGLN